MVPSSSTVTPFPSSTGSCNMESSVNCSSLRGLKGKEDTVEHLQVLLRQEASYPPCADYLSVAEASALHGELVSEAWRRKLCEWCYEVVDHFGFDREVVSIALNYLDRAVGARVAASGSSMGKRDFQLLAVTSLYMAIKIHGECDDPNSPRRKLRIDAFVELSRNFFQVETIEATEREILDSLGWRVNAPSCLRFVAAFLRLIPRWTTDDKAHSNYMGGMFDIARYLTELSVCVSTFSFTAKTSVVAYSAILCANEALQATVAMPYDVRVIMQNNVAEATGLLPNDPQVLRVKSLLKELCPDMFQDSDMPVQLLAGVGSSQNLEQEALDSPSGKTSPVSVVDGPQEPYQGRKRSRTADASQRRLQRSNF